MSRIGKKPIPVPPSVKVELKDGQITVSGPKGQLSWAYPPEIDVVFNEQAREIRVSRRSDDRKDRSLHGLTRSLIANMVTGVTEGYEKRLEVHGVGYQVRLQGRKLLLDLGFTGRKQGRPAEFEIEIPAGLEVVVEQQTNPGRFVIRGIDKQKVGQFAAQIRSLRPPDPYLAKGVRYADEQIRRKPGKAAVGAAGR